MFIAAKNKDKEENTWWISEEKQRTVSFILCSMEIIIYNDLQRHFIEAK